MDAWTRGSHFQPAWLGQATALADAILTAEPAHGSILGDPTLSTARINGAGQSRLDAGVVEPVSPSRGGIPQPGRAFNIIVLLEHPVSATLGLEVLAFGERHKRWPVDVVVIGDI